MPDRFPDSESAQRSQLKRMIWFLLAALLAVCGMNFYKFDVFPFDNANQATAPTASGPRQPTTTTPPTIETESLTASDNRPEPVGWSSGPTGIDPTEVIVTFRDDSVVELSGSSPSWDDALRQETAVQELLDDTYTIRNDLTWHPAAPPLAEFNFRSIEIETETLFGSGEADLTQDPDALIIAAQIALDEPELIIEVIGHTDADGDERSNRRLGIERADSVALFLIEQGVPRDQIVEWSAGEARPKYDNDTDEKRRNRRIELNFIPRPNSDLDKRTTS